MAKIAKNGKNDRKMMKNSKKWQKWPFFHVDMLLLHRGYAILDLYRGSRVLQGTPRPWDRDMTTIGNEGMRTTSFLTKMTISSEQQKHEMAVKKWQNGPGIQVKPKMSGIALIWQKTKKRLMGGTPCFHDPFLT